MKSSKIFFLITICLIFISHFLNAQTTLRISQPRVNNSAYNGSVDEFILRAIPQGAYIEYRAYIRFSARGTPWTGDKDSLEIEFRFKLPENSFINDSWLWFDSTIVKAKLIDRWTAGLIYESIVGRANNTRDPSILFKNNQTDYELRVFPLSGTNSRRIKMNMYIPTNWDAKTISSYCPLAFLKSTAQKAKRVKLITYPNADFQNPRFKNLSSVKFSYMTDTEFGPGWSANLDSADISKLDTLVFDANIKDGVFFSAMKDAKNTYYQLTMNMNQYLKLQVPKRVALMIDWDKNKSDFTKTDILNSLKGTINKYFKDFDKINIFVSDTTVKVLSSEWVTTDSAGKERINRFLVPDTLDSYSNLYQLFDWTMTWLNDTKDSAIIYLLSNTDFVGSRDSSNYLINWIQGTLPPYIPIFIGSHTTKNWRTYTVGALNYAANDYFFGRLSNRTGANFLKVMDYNINLSNLLNSAFSEFMGGSIEQFDFNTRSVDGFTHSKFYRNYKDKTVIDINKPVLEIGKIFGALPLELSASGFYRNTPFNKTVVFDSTYSSPYAYWSNLMWTSLNIYNLETTKPQNPYWIHQILYESLNNRILSLYTAFLALDPEPSDTANKLDLDIPVELMAFNADYINNRVLINWATASERNSEKFEIERADVLPSDITEYRKIAEVRAGGNSDKVSHYGPVADNDVQPGKSYYYRLKMIDLDGTFKYSEEILVETTEASQELMSDVFPNPANSKAAIDYNGINSNLEVQVFDAFGREIDIKITNIANKIVFDLSSINSGIYLVVIKSQDKTITRKINVVK